MLKIYQNDEVDVSSCSVERFIHGSVIVDYVLGFSSTNTPNPKTLKDKLSTYTEKCNQDQYCFGTNSSVSISDYIGMFNFSLGHHCNLKY